MCVWKVNENDIKNLYLGNPINSYTELTSNCVNVRVNE